MAPPAVSWNIAPSMGQSYKCREGELVPIPRYCLTTVHKIGSCHVGEVLIIEVTESPTSRWVLVLLH